jgi:hypothetical protein
MEEVLAENLLLLLAVLLPQTQEERAVRDFLLLALIV